MPKKDKSGRRPRIPWIIRWKHGFPTDLTELAPSIRVGNESVFKFGTIENWKIDNDTDESISKVTESISNVTESISNARERKTQVLHQCESSTSSGISNTRKPKIVKERRNQPSISSGTSNVQEHKPEELHLSEPSTSSGIRNTRKLKIEKVRRNQPSTSSGISKVRKIKLGKVQTNQLPTSKVVRCHLKKSEEEKCKELQASFAHKISKTRRRGFASGLKPEKICGCTFIAGEMKFLMKWQGSNKPTLISGIETKFKCPEIIDEFYHKLLSWTITNE